MANEKKYSARANTSSFIGLQSYTEELSSSFFGRDTEIDTLTKLVQSNSLTIVFGRSGTGKTSLLNAGVFPKLRKNYCLPFRIRLEFLKDSDNLITQIKTVLKKEIERYGFKVESDPTNTDSLWEYFHKEPLWNTVTPILVFDQFEEIFTLAKNNPRYVSTELPALWQELSYLIENTIPESLKPEFLDQNKKIEYDYKKQRTKIVFAFREEYLPEFESVSKIIPSLKTSRFRLMPMNGHQAYEVITKTWKESIQPVEAKRIVSYLTEKIQSDSDKTNKADLQNYNLITVEPSLLSQVCVYIDTERIRLGYNSVSSELLNKYPKETILKSIYEEAVAAAGDACATDKTVTTSYNPVKLFLEEKIITTQGFRTRYHLGEKDESVRPGINVLKENYLIREDEKSVELTHDVLAPIIKRDREKRRKEIALAAERKKTKRRAILLLSILLLVAAGTYYLVTLQARRDRETAIKEWDDAVKKLNNARLELLTVNDSLETSRTLLNNMITPGGKNIPGRLKDSSDYDRLVIAFDSLMKFKTKMEIELNNRITGLNQNINEHNLSVNRLQLQIDRLLPSSNDSVRQLNNQIKILQLDIKDFQKKLAASLENVDLLKKENQQLRKELINIKGTIDSLKREMGDVSINGNLYYDKHGENLVKPANITLYLIPKKNNRKIVRNASIYEISCYEKELKEANGRIITKTDNNGNFVFRKLIPNEEYLLKICTYYGGFYTVKVGDKKPLELSLNASPPVRYPIAN